jgi:16S rRNA (uracil1498-N3)-methyltransferase
MPTNRFYLDTQLTLKTDVRLTGAEHHHLKHVMRNSPGDKVELINGRGSLAKALIKTCTRHETEMEILDLEKAPAPSVSFHLVLGVSQMSKMEIAVEKAVELGATAFTTVMMDRSKKALSPSQKQKLDQIITGALKQCGSLYKPSIDHVLGLTSLSIPKGNTCLFGDVRAKSHNKRFEKQSISFIIGPQAGFSDDEHHYLENRLKATSVHLCSNTLRFETAAIAATAIYCN